MSVKVVFSRQKTEERITQQVVRIPKLRSFKNLTGKVVSKLPDTGPILVQGTKRKPYPVHLTKKTQYNADDLIKGGAFNAEIDTTTTPWTVIKLELVIDEFESPLEEQKKEYNDLCGDY